MGKNPYPYPYPPPPPQKKKKKKISIRKTLTPRAKQKQPFLLAQSIAISSRQPMKELRLLRIQNFKGLPRTLKILRWRRMSHLTSSMPSSRT